MMPVESRAYKLAGISRTSYYRHIQENPEFAKQVEEAKEEGLDQSEIKVYNAPDPRIHQWILSRRRPKKWGNDANDMEEVITDAMRQIAEELFDGQLDSDTQEDS